MVVFGMVIKIVPEQNVQLRINEFWNAKIEANIKRDTVAAQELRKAGWEVLIVWQCETRKPDVLAKNLANFMMNISLPQQTR